MLLGLRLDEPRDYFSDYNIYPEHGHRVSVCQYEFVNYYRFARASDNLSNIEEHNLYKKYNSSTIEKGTFANTRRSQVLADLAIDNESIIRHLQISIVDDPHMTSNISFVTTQTNHLGASNYN